MIALQLFQQILTLFIILFLGMILVFTRVLRSEDSRILSVISVYLVMPCVNINAFQIDYRPEIMVGFLTAIALSILLHLILFVLNVFLKKAGLTDVERMSVIYPNAGNLVLPLISLLFGDEWLIYGSAFMCVQLFFMWTHGISVMSGETRFNWKKIYTNINLISVTIGLLLFLTHVKLPSMLGNAVASVSAMVGPLNMLVIGMMIAGMQYREIFFSGRVYMTVFLRLIGAGFIGVVVLGIAGRLIRIENIQTILTIVLLPLIAPPASTVTQLAQFYNKEQKHSSAVNVLGTLLCIATMPLMMALLQLFF